MAHLLTRALAAQRPRLLTAPAPPALAARPLTTGAAAAPQQTATVSHADLPAAELRRRLDEDGYLFLPKFFDVPAMDALRERAEHLLTLYDPAKDPRSVFSDDASRVGSEYFLASASRISYFQEDAPPAGADAAAAAPAWNKMGHALHDKDEVFARFSRQPKIRALIQGKLMAAPLLVQSMVIFKAARVGGAVVPHQDSTFIHTAPRMTCIGLWAALQSATLDNGCLEVLAGSHRAGIRHRFVLDAATGTTSYRPPRGEPELAAERRLTEDAPWLPLPVDAGGVVILHGECIHKSKANHSDRSRAAYTLHFIEKDSQYSPDNWLQRPNDPFRGFDA